MKIFSLLVLLCWAPLALGADAYISAKDIRDYARSRNLKLRSYVALVFDERDNELILDRRTDEVMPIASLTKLMTAMVILDARLDMDQTITISKADKDRIRYSHSRLKRGMTFHRRDLLQIALTASENRAALALARTYPGGKASFVAAMNHKAHALGLLRTHFVGPAGLGNDNVSTAWELMKIVEAASKYPEIRRFTTQKQDSITDLKHGRRVEFGNTNRLVHRRAWPMTLSKTGYTKDAGNCLVMQTEINSRPLIIVLLESWGKLSKYGDSNRIRDWLIRNERWLRKKQRRMQLRKATLLSKN